MTVLSSNSNGHSNSESNNDITKKAATATTSTMVIRKLITLRLIVMQTGMRSVRYLACK